MKTLLTLAVVSLIAASAWAHGGGNRKGGPGGGAGGGWWNGCTCGTNTCAGNTGTKNYACRISRTDYLQCQDTTCSAQTCPANQLFNYTSLACQACPTGFHVDAGKWQCVCDQGTTPNKATRTCVACPQAATIEADRCFCPNGYVFHNDSNSCRLCPSGSTRSGKGCACTDRKMFWNDVAFACQPCPGSWVNRTLTPSFRRSKTLEICLCPNSGDYFNHYMVACVACPAESTIVTSREGKSSCQCTAAGKVYDYRTNTCMDWAAVKPGKNGFGWDDWDFFGWDSSEEWFGGRFP